MLVAHQPRCLVGLRKMTTLTGASHVKGEIREAFYTSFQETFRCRAEAFLSLDLFIKNWDELGQQSCSERRLPSSDAKETSSDPSIGRGTKTHSTMKRRLIEKPNSRAFNLNVHAKAMPA